MYFGRDGRQGQSTTSRQIHYSSSYAPSPYSSYRATSVVFARPGSTPQVANSFAPPNYQHATVQQAPPFVEAAPPAPIISSLPATAESGSISSALSLAATAFAPPSQTGSLAITQSQNVEHSPPHANPASTYGVPVKGENLAGSQAQAGANAPSPYTPTPTYGLPTKEGGNIAGAQAQAGANAPPPLIPESTYGLPIKESENFAGSQAQAISGENAPSPYSPAPTYSLPTNEGGNFAGAQAQAGANAPPPSKPLQTYGLPTDEAGNVAGAQAGQGAPPPSSTSNRPNEGGNIAGAQAGAPPSPSSYGLPITSSEGSDSSVLTIPTPHCQYGLPQTKSEDLYKVDPIEVSADDVEKNYVFVPAPPQDKSAAPATGFNPPDGALFPISTTLLSNHQIPKLK